MTVSLFVGGAVFLAPTASGCVMPVMVTGAGLAPSVGAVIAFGDGGVRSDCPNAQLD